MYEVYGGMLKEDIVCTIDGKKVVCPPESSILEAARSAGIEIPTLCYLKGLTPTGACGICAVEIEREAGLFVVLVVCARKTAWLFTPTLQRWMHTERRG